MTNPIDAQNLIGRTAVDHEGNKIGKVGQVYLDDQSGQPQWVTISTGLFGTKESFAPIAGSSHDGDDLVLAVSKDQVKGAPSVDADGHLDDSENGELYSYYSGSTYGDSAQANGHADGETNGRASFVDGDSDTGYTSDAQGHDTSGPTTDDAMTRSEEQLTVGTEQVETGRARLRKYVVTEDVTTTVPVSHEEVRLEREPITDANRDDALSGGDITEEEHEVTLHAEQPVVQKETVPVERVRLATETVTEDQQVTEQVRKEQIDAPDVDAALSER
jgi:uncharacterized protein (TIGR02271 family)